MLLRASLILILLLLQVTELSKNASGAQKIEAVQADVWANSSSDQIGWKPIVQRGNFVTMVGQYKLLFPIHLPDRIRPEQFAYIVSVGQKRRILMADLYFYPKDEKAVLKWTSDLPVDYPIQVFGPKKLVIYKIETDVALDYWQLTSWLLTTGDLSKRHLFNFRWFGTPGYAAYNRELSRSTVKPLPADVPVWYKAGTPVSTDSRIVVLDFSAPWVAYHN